MDCPIFSLSGWEIIVPLMSDINVYPDFPIFIEEICWLMFSVEISIANTPISLVESYSE